MSKSPICLIDGSSLCYRAFFSIKLSTAKGVPTGAVFGFYKTLKKIISKYKPSSIGICFDISRKTFRHEKFEEYKSNRVVMPDDLKSQIPLIKKLVKYLGITIIEKEGFEADDVIASLCRKAIKEDKSVLIVSPDKDFYQLIGDENVSIYNCTKDKVYNKEVFTKEFGFGPEFMRDYLSLAGDSADNIPGARGIGKVGAANLIKEFGSIEDIFNNLDKCSKKMKIILEQNKENIYLSEELVALFSCELEESLQDLEIKDPDLKGLHYMFNELEFKALLKDIPAPTLDLNIEVKEKVDKKSLQRLIKEPLILFVEEENIFIYDAANRIVYKNNILDLKQILEEPNIKKISYNFKDQFSCFQDIDIEIQGLFFDIKIAAYLLDSSLSDYSLSSLDSYYLGEIISEIPAKFSPYFIYQLYKILSIKIKEQKLEELFYKVEMPLISILDKMHIAGVKVDGKVLNELVKAVNSKSQKVKKKIFDIVGKEFNLNSPKQLSIILFEDLGIKPIKKTKTGYSTGEEVLEKLSSEHSIANYILEYRGLAKLETTYILPIIEEVKKNKGFLHAQFNQASTQTGRLSSSAPNLQSIPVKGEFSAWLRKSFLPSFEKGYFIAGDYSQIELRILADLSGDHILLDAFRKDLDIHSFTAALLFDINEDEVTDAQRVIAKRVNFGIIYGMSSYGLSKELKISPLECQDFINDYFNRYPGVKIYMDKIKTLTEKEGVVKTILGRPRKFGDINNLNSHLKDFALRQAINAPIQGSCADLIKIAMVKINEEIKTKQLKTKLIIQIHDELVFDVPEEEFDEVKDIVKINMENSLKLNIPIKVNIKYGRNWGEMSVYEDSQK